MASRQSGPVIEAFSVRKEPKGHGTKRRIEGNFAEGDAVVVAEDVITTGGSALKAIEGTAGSSPTCCAAVSPVPCARRSAS